MSPCWQQTLLGQIRSLNRCHREQQLHCQLDLPAALRGWHKTQIRCRRRRLQQVTQLPLTCQWSMDTLTAAVMRLMVTALLAVQPVAEPQVTITAIKGYIGLRCHVPADVQACKKIEPAGHECLQVGMTRDRVQWQ